MSSKMKRIKLSFCDTKNYLYQKKKETKTKKCLVPYYDKCHLPVLNIL